MTGAASCLCDHDRDGHNDQDAEEIWESLPKTFDKGTNRIFLSKEEEKLPEQVFSLISSQFDK